MTDNIFSDTIISHISQYEKENNYSYDYQHLTKFAFM